MIRTAILAGLLLVMLSIAYARIDLPPIPIRDTALITEPPPVEPSLPSEAAKPVPKRTAAAQPPRPSRVHVEAPQVDEEPTVEETPAAERVNAPESAPVHVAAVVPAAPAPAVVAPPPSPAAPLSLLTPPEPAAPKAAAVAPPTVQAPVPLVPPAATVEQAAVEASAPPAPPMAEKPTTLTKVEDMPLIQVAPRRAMTPWDAPPGTVHNSVVAQANDPTAKPAADAPKFMTPQERSRELYRLARDMEDLFITKLTH